MLSADGARRLRVVRDHLLANPNDFDWGEWCGTRCCIAGHLLKFQYESEDEYAGYDSAAAELLGLSPAEARPLFYGFENLPNSAVTDVVAGAKAIAAFLWEHGYPVQELTIPTPSAEQAQSLVAVDPHVD